jgi:hypothetical protein
MVSRKLTASGALLGSSNVGAPSCCSNCSPSGATKLSGTASGNIALSGPEAIGVPISNVKSLMPAGARLGLAKVVGVASKLEGAAPTYSSRPIGTSVSVTRGTPPSRPGGTFQSMTIAIGGASTVAEEFGHGNQGELKANVPFTNLPRGVRSSSISRLPDVPPLLKPILATSDPNLYPSDLSTAGSRQFGRMPTAGRGLTTSIQAPIRGAAPADLFKRKAEFTPGLRDELRGAPTRYVELPLNLIDRHVPAQALAPFRNADWWGMEPRLLSLLIESARARPGASDATVWDRAWQARTSSGILSAANAVPVGVALTRAIISVARHRQVGPKGARGQDIRAALLGSPEPTSSRLLERAVARVRAEAINQASDPFADPYGFDDGLFGELVLAARERARQLSADGLFNYFSVAEAFAMAWEKRSGYGPWPIAVPEHSYIAAVVAAGLLSFLRYPEDKKLMKTLAKAEYLFNLLGGSRVRMEVGSVYIETELRDVILDYVADKTPKGWKNLIDAADEESKQRGGLGGRPAVPPGIERLRPGSLPAWVGAGQRLRDAINAVAGPAWHHALRVRDDDWRLPWPPSPLPDKRFVQSLVAAAWTYPTMRAADLSQIAAIQIGRKELPRQGELWRLRQPEGVAILGFTIGYLAAALIGTGIVATAICLAGGCITLYNGIKAALAKKDDGDPEEALPSGSSSRPTHGTGNSAGGGSQTGTSGAEAQQAGPKPAIPAADPCKTTEPSPICGTAADRASRATTESKAADRLARGLWDLPSSDPFADGKTIGEYDIEHGAAIIRKADGSLRYGTITSGTNDHIDFNLDVGDDEQIVGIVHSHPANSEHFSNTDTWQARVFRDNRGRARELNHFSYSYILIRPSKKGNPPRLLVFEPRVGGNRGTVTEIK